MRLLKLFGPLLPAGPLFRPACLVNLLLLTGLFSCHKNNDSPNTVAGTVQQISTGYSNTFFITPGDSLWAVGGDRGMFGDGQTAGEATSPRFIMAGVKTVSARLDHVLVLKNDGTVWSCGYNIYGQLGDGTENSNDKFQQIMTDVIAISAGFWSSYMIKSDNTLWAAGRNDHGELGDGSQANKDTPEQIMTNVNSVYPGYYTTFVRKTDNSLWISGEVDQYYGSFSNQYVGNSTQFVQVLTDVKGVSVGVGDCAVIKADNSLWVMGANGTGQLGDGTTTANAAFEKIMDDVAQVSVGYYHMLILKTDHTVWAAGDNEYGELGDGKGGAGAAYQTTPEQIATDAKAVYAGYNNFSYIQKTDNSLWVSGQNLDGQLGDGTTTTQLSLEKIQPIR